MLGFAQFFIINGHFTKHFKIVEKYGHLGDFYYGKWKINIRKIILNKMKYFKNNVLEAQIKLVKRLFRIEFTSNFKNIMKNNGKIRFIIKIC